MKMSVLNSVFNKVAGPQSATLLRLRSNSGIDFFLQILQNFVEHLLIEHFQ